MTAIPVAVGKPRSQRRRMARSPYGLVVCGLCLGLIVLTAIWPLVASAGPNDGDITQRLHSPVWLGGDGGLLGTDQLGRSVLSQCLYGLGTSYTVGILAIVLGASLGITAGLVAGYVGGRTGGLIMSIADIQNSLPSLLLSMTLVVIAGGGMAIVTVVLGLNTWTIYARVMRTSVLRLKSSEFIMAQVSLGARPRRIMWLHVLPNVLSLVIAITTFEVARIMLAEATLSFLGFGIQPPKVSLGSVLAQGQDVLSNAWWISTFAGAVLALSVLLINLVGSWLSSAMDPLASGQLASDMDGVRL